MNSRSLIDWLLLFCAIAGAVLVLYVSYLASHPDNQEQPAREEENTVTCTESFCGLPATPVLTPEEKYRASVGKRIHGPACFNACTLLEGSFVHYDHLQEPEERCLCVYESQGVFFFVFNYEEDTDNIEFNIIPDY